MEITDFSKQIVAIELGKILEDETMLFIKTKNAHWCMDHTDFCSKNLFFEDQFNHLDKIIDNIEDRIRSIGHFAPSTINLYLSLTFLTKHPQQQNDTKSLINDLIGCHESIIILLHEGLNSLSDEICNVGMNDFIMDIKENHEKMAYFLKSELNNKSYVI